ncbi:MAG: hypothetical protein A2864_01410 [Candidatus Woykebacteria bacterium RIFCSPHIGHO2_01_FULL_39_12]|uniref:Type IV pilus modification protein PilV n=2 Tax=Candidatus Woykeibacteriota TaxID=1817899 RepID=A0A1G1WD81_9BACT|nr:MAG: hypothetical protein A2134_01430 [Candidatus Woykebacteria bacterium RBG_16_39_9b]OGY27333.1 MAG: hypothetical protein A2864_01410 [Candidatus Woykebacteria bacterium RIFCSPHIGHO2_01_FULL_39_12]
MKNLFGKSGQTLLEVVVTIGISSIIILSIVALGITVQRNATFARTSTQASKLAEEGVELVRSIRDQEGSVTGCGGPGCAVWTDLYNIKFGTGQTFALNPASPPTLVLSAVPESINLTGFTGFSRIVRIRDCVDPSNPANINTATCDFRSLIADGGKQDYQEWKEVTVTVSWTDSRGLHEAKQITVLRSVR